MADLALEGDSKSFNLDLFRLARCFRKWAKALTRGVAVDKIRLVLTLTGFFQLQLERLAAAHTTAFLPCAR